MSEMKIGNPDSGQLSGFDAYENAWDVVSKHLWTVLGFNVFWLIGLFFILLVIYLITVMGAESWALFVTISVIFFLFLSPIWEAANILRFTTERSFPHGDKLPISRIIVARIFFLFIVSLGYLIILLPGIYLHSRLSLYLPILLRSNSVNSYSSLYKSWILTHKRFIRLYTLWIAIVISKPVSLLPFGLGFLVDRPICGFAKDIMFFSCTNRSRDGPV